VAAAAQDAEAMSARCACGCGRWAANRHHCVYEAELRRLWRSAGEDHQRRVRTPTAGNPLSESYANLSVLLDDPRNLVPVAFHCHGAHHNASRRLPMHALPDAVFEFAAEVLGPEQAYEYLRRRYDGMDLRHERLLVSADA
jgi:hypothetical protein